jgi:imidazoleglycerol-phosphate dehydratase
MRVASVVRNTKETKVKVDLNLDGTGEYEIKTGISFFDHMLMQIARHGIIDLKITAAGDLEVDPHHTVEDTGIVLGQALKKALGEKMSISRYGSAYVPMDEALALVVIDLCGRAFSEVYSGFGEKPLGQLRPGTRGRVFPGSFLSIGNEFTYSFVGWGQFASLYGGHF